MINQNDPSNSAPAPDCKTCSKCGEVKALSEFYKNCSPCKNCKDLHVAAYRKANPEKAAARNANWRKANPEKVAAAQAAYRKKKPENPEKAAARKAAWRKANPENPKERNDRNSAWRKKNPEKLAANRSAYGFVERAELRPSYVARMLQIPVSQLTPELLELKREQLLFKRLARDLTQAAKADESPQ